MLWPVMSQIYFLFYQDSELSKLQTKLDKLKEQHSEEMERLTGKRDVDITELRDNINKKDEQLKQTREELDATRNTNKQMKEDSEQIKVHEK